MYYCLACKTIHDLSESGSIFNSGFTKQNDEIVRVGICAGSSSIKRLLDDLEPKLGYI
jgi:hypothetical protein